MPTGSRGRTPFACPNDNSIRITKTVAARIIGFVLEESSVLLLQPVRPALVIIVEERDERTIRVREQGVPRLGNTAIRPVTDKADLVMRPLEFLQHYGRTIREPSSTMTISRGVHVCARAQRTARRILPSAL